MRLRWLACLLALNSAASAQDIHGDVQSIPYELLDRYAMSRIGFENFATWKRVPKLISGQLAFESAAIGTVFAEQYENGQITGRYARDPLSFEIIENVSASPPERDLVPGTFNTSGTYTETQINYPSQLLGLAISNNNTITTNNWLFRSRSRLGWMRTNVVGQNPVSILFNEDQFAVGFRVIPLNNFEQRGLNSQQTGFPRLRIKFFRRNSTMISEIVLTPDQSKYLAFARCGQGADIGGIQITNSTKTGLAFDDFIFDLPDWGVPPDEANESVQVPRQPNSLVEDNPLQIELCAYYIS